MSQTSNDLTVDEVTAILARAGVDHSQLTITHDPDVWIDLETGRGSTSVIVTGPDQHRRTARAILYGAGLSCASYPERDMWSRPSDQPEPDQPEPDQPEPDQPRTSPPAAGDVDAVRRELDAVRHERDALAARLRELLADLPDQPAPDGPLVCTVPGCSCRTSSAAARDLKEDDRG